jgi:hypothetical protein
VVIVFARKVFIHFAHNAVAYAALFIALGGTSYAALKLPAQSVGSAQLKNQAVTPKKVAPATIRLFKGQTGERGAIGAQGAKGDPGVKGDPGGKGDPGAKGDAGATNVVVRRSTVFTTGGIGFSNQTASCAAGERAVGGGAGLTSGGSTTAFTVVDAKPVPTTAGAIPTGWNAAVSFTVAGLEWAVYAICSSP